MLLLLLLFIIYYLLFVIYYYYTVEDFLLVNHILLLDTYIFYRQCQNSLLTLKGFFAKARHVFNIELHIAREKSKLPFHLQKCEKLINELKSW